VGRHSGVICTACRHRILVRDGRLIEHQHTFPTLGTSVTCVGSDVRVAAPAAVHEAPKSPVPNRAVLVPPLLSQPHGRV
jgi:hypothetical protein